MSHKHLITEILSIASSILPPPPLSIRLYNSEIDADTIIQEQLSMNTEKLKIYSKHYVHFILERHLHKLENNDLQQLSNILLILIAVPPPILPPIPEPSHRVKMVY